MRKEYDLTKLKVKRRGPLEGLHGVPEAPQIKTVQNFTDGSHPISWDGSHLISS